MDALTLHMWADAVSPTLAGRSIVDSGASRDWRFHVGFDDDRWLLLSLERELTTVFIDARAPGRFTGGLPQTFAEALRGATLRSVRSVPGERILIVETDRGELVVEFFPSHPTLVWVTGGLVAAVHRNGRIRRDHVEMGAAYAPPPSERPHPGLNRRVAEALAVTDESWADILNRAASGGRVMVTKPSGHHLVSPVPLPGAPITAEESEINDAVRAAFLLNLADARRDRDVRAWRSRVIGARKRLQRTLEAVTRDHEQAERWPEWERVGSSLLAAPHLVPRGAKSVRIPDVFDAEGGEIEVTLDPRIEVAANAAVYLKRATRGKRGLPQIETRLLTMEEDIEWISVREATPKEKWSEADRTHFDELLQRHRMGHGRSQKAASGKKRRTEAGPGFHPRRFLSADGWTILVGRSNAENDWLSLKYAKGDDIWLHAQGVAGSHVVIRRDGRKDNPSQRTLQEAAGLAATFSKARHSKHVSVMYTLAKYVRKPRKAGPGLVTCEREKTLMVEPLDPKQLRSPEEG